MTFIPTLGGTVSVDHWYQQLRTGHCFGAMTIVAASLGNLSQIQLFNPVGSTINAIVFLIHMATDVSDAIFCAFFDTALATLVGTGSNLLSGSAASICQIRTSTPAVGDGTAFYRAVANGVAGTYLLPLFPMCELGPGKGVLTRPSTVNEGQSTSFLWLELPTTSIP